MGYQGGRRYGGYDRETPDNYGRDRYGSERQSGDWDRANDRYRPATNSYRYGARGQASGGSDHRGSEYDPDDRGFFDRAGDEIRSWFGDEEAERRREYDDYYYNRDPNRDYQGRDYRGASYTASSNARYDADRGYAPYAGHNDRGGGQTRDRDRSYSAHDGNYQVWRRERIAEMDRDYADYQRENRDRFHQEFTGWRSRRTEQRQALGQVREHMDVVGSDGEHVGTVDKLRGDRIILTKNDSDAGGVHHSIPCGWIKAVDATKVTLEKTADQAQTAWREEREQQAMFNKDRDDRSDNGTTTSFLDISGTRYR